MDIMQRFEDFYQHLSERSLKDISEVYSKDVTFVDPVTRHHGLVELTAYFKGLLTKCRTCSFEIDSSERSGNAGYVSWSMFYSHPYLNSGEQIRVDGFSLLQLKQGRVIHQRDYYDMGAMIYEQIPFFGRLIIFLRRRLAT
jgi:hypothetical protein